MIPILPQPMCGPGWTLEGKIARYDQDTLSDRIDGEAELYFPYGFQFLASGRYTRQDQSFDLDVFRMGSLLDAFGVYANYRPKGAEPVPAVTEGGVTPDQLFFYQERYFIRLQSTGNREAGKGALVACAQAVSRLLPAGVGMPPEIDFLAIPEVLPRSVLYNATSLLGYDFLHRGMMADAVIGGETVRLFISLENSNLEAEKSFLAYRNYLQTNGSGSRPVTTSSNRAVVGVDPLYGTAVVDVLGRYVFGMVRVKDTAAALPVMEKMRRKLVK